MIAFHAHVHFKIDHETSKSMINTFANIVWSNSSIYNCELQYVLFTAVNNKADPPTTYKLALFHAATFSIDSSGNVVLTYTGGTAWQRVSSIICAQCWNEQAICMWKFKFYGCKNLIFYIKIKYNGSSAQAIIQTLFSLLPRSNNDSCLNKVCVSLVLVS